MKAPSKCRNIEEIRTEIDRIDKLIISTLAERFEYVKEAAKFKKNPDEVMASDRHTAMLQQRQDLCNKLNVDYEMVENVYKILLDYYKQKQLEIWNKIQKK